MPKRYLTPFSSEELFQKAQDGAQKTNNNTETPKRNNFFQIFHVVGNVKEASLPTEDTTSTNGKKNRSSTTSPRTNAIGDRDI